jgi:predicted transcriptional regulator
MNDNYLIDKGILSFKGSTKNSENKSKEEKEFTKILSNSNINIHLNDIVSDVLSDYDILKNGPDNSTWMNAVAYLVSSTLLDESEDGIYYFTEKGKRFLKFYYENPMETSTNN